MGDKVMGGQAMAEESVFDVFFVFSIFLYL
jgi:hypothetical protein